MSALARMRPADPRLAVLGLLGLALFVAVNVALAVVVIGGTLDGHWYDFRDLGIAVQELRVQLDEEFHPAVSYWVTALIGGVGIISVVGGALLILPWVERRLLARIQVRRGPNRVGPFGLLQSLADAFKLMQKETVIPRGADLLMYLVPPVFVFIPAMLVWGPVPWAPGMSYLDINVGVLYLVAVGSLATLAIFMAGWSSNNHYAALGAMRTVAMMVSYEIPLSLSLVAMVLLTGSLQLSEIVQWQADHHLWLAVLLPFALFTFFFSSTAELNRTPNDIAEAESEIVAGYFTEYSGMKAGLFMAVELGNALAVGALVSTFFLGGWSAFGLEQWVPGYLILASKISAMYFLFVWSRASVPRFRLDQLMKFAWQYLIPLSLLQVLVVAIEASVLARWDVAAALPLTIFAIVNLLVMGVAVWAWARFVGYRPEQQQARHPLLTASVGGLQAAQRLRAGAEAGAPPTPPAAGTAGPA